MSQLHKLGMQNRWIYEAIISTYDGRVPHATPIGVWTNDLITVQSDIFKGSQTMQNIMRNEYFVVNFVPSVDTYYAALFDKDVLAYEDSLQIAAPVLRNCPAIVEVQLTHWKDLDTKVQIEGRVIHVQVRDGLRLINRAESLLLESLILATRLSFSPKSREALLENYRVIRKVAPESEYQKTMEKLMNDLSLFS